MGFRLLLAILLGVLLAWPIYRLATCRCWRRMFYRQNLQCVKPYQPRLEDHPPASHDRG
ncbi:MAG: hypothetical protein H6R01_316 [Burkholderiaceae bacterium]|nr:hypothetical protein [Burkholderiaceae bacterium]